MKQLMFEKTALIVKLIKGEKGSVFLIILSLSFIVTPIVSTCIILDSNSVTSLNNETIAVKVPCEIDLLSYPLETIAQIQEDLDKCLLNANLNSFVNNTWINPQVSVHFMNASNNPVGNLFFYDEIRERALESLLLPGGKLPQKPNEIILVIPETTQTFYHINSSYHFSLESSNLSVPLIVTGILSLPQLSDSYYYSYEVDMIKMNYIQQIRLMTGMKLGNCWDDIGNYSLITQKNDFKAVIKKMAESSGKTSRELIINRDIEVTCLFNEINLKTHEGIRYIERLKSLESYIRELYPFIWVNYSEFEKNLEESHIIRNNLFFEYLVMSIPLIIISFFFLKFVINNTVSLRIKRIKTLRIRGISLKQILILFTAEMVVSFILSIILGFILSAAIAISLILLLQVAPVVVLNPNSWFYYLVATNGFFTILIFGMISFRISRFHFRKFETSDNVKEYPTHSPWAVKILITGLIIFLLSFFQNELLDSSVLPLDYGTKMIIAILALFLTSIGLVFSFKTIFILFTRILSKKLWFKSRMSSVAIAFKNVNRYIKSTSDVMLFLTLLIAYSFSLMAYSFSMELSFEQQAEFITGADYRIQFNKSDETALKNYIHQNISDISSLTKVVKANARNRHGFLGIDPYTYFKVAYKHPQFRLSTTLDSLQEAIMTNNHSIWVSEGLLHQKGLTIGSAFQLTDSFRNYSMTYLNEYYPFSMGNVTIVGSFRIYPLIAEQASNYLSTQAIIIHQQFLEGLEEFSSPILQYFFLIRCNSPISIKILQYLENTYHVSITDIYTESQQLKTDKHWKQFFSAQQTSIIFSLVLSSGWIIIFGLFQINDRTREHTIERVLGLKKREIFSIILFEELFIVISALIGGVLVGTWFSTVFLYNQNVWAFFIFEKGLTPSVILPIVPFLPYLLVFIVFMCISILPSLIFHQRYEIGSLLKKFT